MNIPTHTQQDPSPPQLPVTRKIGNDQGAGTGFPTSTRLSDWARRGPEIAEISNLCDSMLEEVWRMRTPGEREADSRPRVWNVPK